MAKHSSSARQRFWIWAGIIMVLAIGVMTLFGLLNAYNKADVNALYYHPFEGRAKVVRENKNHGSAADPVRSPGLHEDSIRKLKGRHYETY